MSFSATLEIVYFGIVYFDLVNDGYKYPLEEAKPVTAPLIDYVPEFLPDLVFEFSPEFCL